MDGVGERDLVAGRAGIRALYRREPGATRGGGSPVVPADLPRLSEIAQGSHPLRALSSVTVGHSTPTYTSSVEERPRVLIVEDDARLAGMLGELLHSEGYDVSLAADGQRGLHLGLTETFDVLVLDRGLPVVDGLDVLTKLRTSGVLTPVLVLSALGNAADRVEGLDRGAEDYLAKPFDIDELLARLRVLRRRLAATVPIIRFPGGQLEADNRTVALDDGGRFALSEREAALLERLARRPSQ